ncbi:MAG: ATP-binding cassette domain-containing protein [Eubacteriales bacterium]
MGQVILNNAETSEEDIIKACKKADIYDFINSLPKRFETVVGEDGINFSGGQKQRFSIARAYLSSASTIIFDEATSALDSITENNIKTYINDMSKNKIIIIISHKINFLEICDNIYVFKDGKIVEEGSHAKLIKQNKLYYKMSKLQSNQ